MSESQESCSVLVHIAFALCYTFFHEFQPPASSNICYFKKKRVCKTSSRSQGHGHGYSHKVTKLLSSENAYLTAYTDIQVNRQTARKTINATLISRYIHWTGQSLDYRVSK